MKNISRRSLFTAGMASLVGVTLLSGCVTTKVDGVTTITLNVAKINDYVQAGINAANTIVGVIQVIPKYTSQVDTLNTILAKLQAASVALTNAANGKLEINYAETDKKVLIDSILNLIMTVSDQVTVVLNMVTPGSTILSDSKIASIRLIQDSLTTIVSVFRALLRTSNDYSSTTTTNGQFAEYKALKVLGV